jgi:BirA family biotin operon repressor/biotin-[acetyl-CoA-carboxylase] ligase
MPHNSVRRALDETALRNAASIPGPTWRRLDVVAETGSTNADLIARASGGEDIAGTVLITEHQTAGRGRNGRTWLAVPRALITMSMGIPTTDIPAAAWGWVPLVTGLAVVDAVAEVSGVRAGLKWPNDVLAGPEGHKLAGILAEVAPPASVIVVGVGLNVSLRADELPDPAAGSLQATSLQMLGAGEPDREALVGALLTQMARRIDGLRRAGGADAALLEEYTARSLTIGSRVRATMPGDLEVVGEALGIDDQGRVRIDTGGDVVVVSAGDIVHLRRV